MRLKALLAGVMMLAVLLSPSVFAEEDTDAYHLVITYPDREYKVGDTVDVTVHVFEEANYVSVDNVTLDIGPYGDMREVEVVEGATGKWAGTFTIQEADVTDILIYRMVSMAATAQVNSTTVEITSGMILMPTAVEEEVTLVITSSLSPPSVYMGPGETKTVTWEIRYDGQLVDATTIEGSTFEGSNYDTFEPARSSTGVYTHEYMMPSGPRSNEVDINLDVTYNTGTETVDGESDVNLFLNYLHIWAKKGAVSATTASFDLFVSNQSGAPVEAAAISIDFYYEDDDFNEKSGYTNGTTDVDGRATIEMDYNNLGDTATGVDISGKVTGQGKEQEINFDLRVRADADEPPDPETLGFDVVPDKEMFEFDKDVNLPATAYYDGEPHGSSTVYWYAYTQHAVMNKGEKSTKVDGSFSVDFRTPAKGTMDPAFLMTHYQTPIEDGDTYVYDDTEDGVITSLTDIEGPDNPYDTLRQYRDSAVQIDVDKLEKNKEIPVTVTYNKADEEWLVAVMVGIDPNPGNMGLVPSWTYWTTSFMTGVYGDICNYDGSKFETSIFLPENLPNNNYYVAGMCVNQRALMSSFVSGNFADYIKTNYLPGLEIGQSGSSGGNGGDSLLDSLMEDFLFGIPLLYWLFIIIIVIAVAIIAGMMMTRKRDPKEMAQPGLEATAEGPSFDGGPGAAAMPMPVTSYDEMQPVAGQAEYGAQPPQPGYDPGVAVAGAAVGAAGAEYAAPPPPAQPQPGMGEPLPSPDAAYAVPPQPEYAAPPPPGAPPQPEYAAPAAPPQPDYAIAPPPAVEPQPEYAAPAAPPVQEYAAPPQPGYAAPPAPAPEVPPPAPVDPMAPPPAAPVAPQVPPPAPAVPPPAAAPPPAVAPAATAPAAAPPAADAGATMTIRCQKCQTTLTIPRKRPIKVTCPNCGASGVLR